MSAEAPPQIKLITFQQACEVRVRLAPDLFVTGGGSGKPVDIEVPSYLFIPEDREKAQVALNICRSIVGGFGQNMTNADDGYREAAAVFFEITGVDVQNILKLAFQFNFQT